jgi:hypothetical protein
MFQLAQINIAKARGPMDDAVMKEFSDNLDPINQIAESSPGFIWRLKDESGNATDIQSYDDQDIIINISVWECMEALKNFMFKTHHIDFLKRKKEWFYPMSEVTYALWWVPLGHQPNIDEAKSRLLHLQQHGESPQAFSFKNTFSWEES